MKRIFIGFIAVLSSLPISKFAFAQDLSRLSTEAIADRLEAAMLKGAWLSSPDHPDLNPEEASGIVDDGRVFWLETGKRHYRILFNKVDYIEKESNRITVHCLPRGYSSDSCFDYVVSGPGFFDSDEYASDIGYINNASDRILDLMNELIVRHQSG